MKLELALISIALLAPAAAQMQDNQQPQMKCNDGGNHRRARFCEIREQRMPYGGLLDVDGQQNGGVSVRGWSRNEVWVRIKVDTTADSDSAAQSLASQVRVTAGAGKVMADGPSQSGETNWSVSYEIFAPHQSDLILKAHNGGVHITDIRGNLQFSTQNGGIHLERIAGRVKGETVNGGVHVKLAGPRWDGDGLDLTTTNGGVHVEVPENYSARLEASTANGGVHSDFGGTVQNKASRQLSTTLGSGGATIRLVTTNGGVHVGRS